MMKLTQQQLNKYGVRSAEPIPECKGFTGWVAKARFRLTDQEVMVLDTHYFFEENGQIQDNKNAYQFVEIKTELETAPTEEGYVATFRWKRTENSAYINEATDTNDNPPTITRTMTRHLTWPLILNRARGNNGLFLGAVETQAAIRIIAPITTESQGSPDPALQWWVFQGEPDDLDKLYHWHQKSYGWAFKDEQNIPWFVQASDINPDGGRDYCSRGTPDITTIFGLTCRFDNRTETESFNKIVKMPRAVVRKMQMGDPNPWTEGPRWVDQTFFLNFPKDPELRPVHKKGNRRVGQTTTDNCVGLPGREDYDQELFVSSKRLMPGGTEITLPDKTISARLHQVEFFFCGCNDNEIECLGPDDEVCCVDCCKIGNFVLDLFGDSV